MDSRWSTVIGLCFSYSFFDVLFMEEGDCMKPMQNWTLVSNFNLSVLLCLQMIGRSYSHLRENFIFSMRQCSLVSQVAILLNWGVLMPFNIAWTALGTMWFYNALRTAHASSGCASIGCITWLVLFWLVLSYCVVVIYVVYFSIACVVEYRLQQARKNMQLIQSNESLLRWGPLSAIVDTSDLSLGTMLQQSRGLQPEEIQALPSRIVQKVDRSHDSCSICLADFTCGERVRQLPGCGHQFHSGCVDVWLLRQSECPLCKSDVRS